MLAWRKIVQGRHSGFVQGGRYSRALVRFICVKDRSDCFGFVCPEIRILFAAAARLGPR